MRKGGRTKDCVKWAIRLSKEDHELITSVLDFNRGFMSKDNVRSLGKPRREVIKSLIPIVNTMNEIKPKRVYTIGLQIPSELMDALKRAEQRTGQSCWQILMQAFRVAAKSQSEIRTWDI